MRSALRIACMLLVLIVGGQAVAQEASNGVICGKEWIVFEPLHPEPFSEELGFNAYMVQKSDILRLSQGVRRLQFGYVILTPLKGDARSDGTYRVTREAYLAIQACLLDLEPGTR